MPTLSMFYGIIVRMFFEQGGQHHVPHLHAVYGDENVTVGLDGQVLEGSLPKKQMKLLLAWMEIHSEELYANWQLLQEGEPFFKIEPLR